MQVLGPDLRTCAELGDTSKPLSSCQHNWLPDHQDQGHASVPLKLHLPPCLCSSLHHSFGISPSPYPRAVGYKLVLFLAFFTVGQLGSPCSWKG